MPQEEEEGEEGVTPETDEEVGLAGSSRRAAGELGHNSSLPKAEPCPQQGQHHTQARPLPRLATAAASPPLSMLLVVEETTWGMKGRGAGRRAATNTEPPRGTKGL